MKRVNETQSSDNENRQAKYARTTVEEPSCSPIVAPQLKTYSESQNKTNGFFDEDKYQEIIINLHSRITALEHVCAQLHLWRPTGARPCGMEYYS
jgi:hypothetical protein